MCVFSSIRNCGKWSEICVKIFPLVILELVKLVNILSMIVAELFEILVGLPILCNSIWPL